MSILKLRNEDGTWFTVTTIKGEPGPQGDPGKQGPKGDDYILTENDKKEIAEQVEGTLGEEIEEVKENLSQKADKTELAEKVGSTDWATTAKGGVIKAANGVAVHATLGTTSAVTYVNDSYSRLGDYIFVSKGTLENVLAERLKEKEWTFKGTITTENKDAGLNVDLSGCTEIFIKGTYSASGNATINANGESLWYLSSVSQTRSIFGKSIDDGISISPQFFGYSASANLQSTTVNNIANAYIRSNSKRLANFNRIVFSNPANITECNIEIYAR